MEPTLRISTIQLVGTRRKIIRAMHQARHPLFVTIVRRKAIEFPTIGISRHVPYMGIKAILRLLVERIK